MAVYGSLISLMNLIDQLQTHPNPPITLHKDHLQSLSKNVTSLKEILEVYSHSAIKEADEGLESCIMDAAYVVQEAIEAHIAQIQRGSMAYVVQDVIESRVAQIQRGSTGHWMSIKRFYDVNKIVRGMSLFTKEAMKIKDKIGNQDHQLHRHLTCDNSRTPPSVGIKNAMVGFDDVFKEVLDKLTGDQPSRQIIPIVGMGGIGKTTLASNVYDNQLTIQHFYIRSWVICSQGYNVKEILSKVLLDQNKNERRELLSQLSEGELGDKVRKRLYGRRYLVIMDDMWSVEVWNRISYFFPNNNNRSRIIITTRDSSVASKLSKEKIMMDFLNDQQSWDLLRSVVSGEEVCPTELEESGRKIAKNCKGLPLSIAVMGGLLAKSKQTQEDWAFIAKKLNSNMNLEHEKHCLQILHTSFDYMPIHLKPCLLYIGAFPEDTEIRMSHLIRLWVAEGFVEKRQDRSLESIAEEYLMDLIDRNLVLAKVIGSTGKVKICGMHDLTSDLCIEEARNDRFLCVARKHNLGIEKSIYVQRRVAIHRSTLKGIHLRQALDAFRSASLVRSMVCDVVDVFPNLPLGLFRILNVSGYGYMYPRKIESFFKDILQSVNLRFLAFNPVLSLNFKFPSSIYLLWNLQTIILDNDLFPPFELWKMYQLRHVKVNRFRLQNPALGVTQDRELVLQNLQTLSCVINFRLSQEVVKRIPNVRKLKLTYTHSFKGCPHYRLNNLGHLQKLESLSCSFKPLFMPSKSDSLWNIAFPRSLVKLELAYTSLNWEDVATEIGLLPHLQVLKLIGGVQGSKWNLVEGRFQCLRFLLIEDTDLEYWMVEGNHFPCLEHLALKKLRRLKEIPSDIGNADMLQSIELRYCNNAVVNSAQNILDEQQEFGNTELKVRLWNNLSDRYVELRPNKQEEEKLVIVVKEEIWRKHAWRLMHL